MQTCQNTGIRRFFQKQSKPALTRENNPQSVQNNMNLSITDTHNGNHVIQRYIRHTYAGAVTRTITKIIQNVFQVIRG